MPGNLLWKINLQLAKLVYYDIMIVEGGELSLQDNADKTLISQKALLLKALSNPVRLCILKELVEKGSANVSSMQKCMDISQSTVSQHLGKLRDVGIIKAERKGTEVYYSLLNNEVAAVINLLFPAK